MARLVLFDLDNTLVDRNAAVPASIAAVCMAAGYGQAMEEWLTTELADRAAPDVFARFRTTFRLIEPVGSLWRAYVDAMAGAVSCRPEVLQGLGELRDSGWTIGVVTNGASDIQRAKLRATGIHDLIDGVAVRGDIEIRKPDRRFFHLAAHRCGTELGDGWAVGDNPTADITGAQQAGLRSIWLRGRPWPGGLALADHAVDDVLEAITFLLNDAE
ncbi:HAD family hydrolase [Streptomyces puniciscabiei]